MKKLEEMLREKPIKNKLSFVFRIMDVLYVVLALETLGEETLKAFQLRRIAPDEVNLTPKLIRFTR